MSDLANRIMQQQSEMEAVRGNWESMWEDVARLVLPRADDFRQKHSPGTQRNQHQYDAFPMLALDKFSAVIEAGLMPRTSMWHKLTTGDPEFDEAHEVRLYLDEVNQILWDKRYSAKANFASQASEVRLSLGSFGTGCMFVEAREGGGICYKSIHLSEIFIRENWEGMIDTVHRKFELTARQAVQIFKDATPKKILDKYNSGKGGDKFEFIHAVFPREDRDPTRLDEKGLPFAGIYLFTEGQEILREDGYHEMPYIVSRYAVSSREIYGRSPAIQLLPDISMLNEMRRTTIEAANMAVDPPVLLPDDAISEFDLTPGSRNYGASDDQGRPLALPWNPGVNVGLGLEMMQDTRNQIDDGFLGATFRVLLENPQMTATQALLIAQQQGQMSAPVIGRLQTEWLGPLIRRESGILFRQGAYPEIPPALRDRLQSTRESLQIEYVSPLVRAARSEEGISILRTFESLAPIAQVDPTVFDRFDMAEIPDILADVNGVPERALKAPEVYEAEREQEADQAALGNVLQAAPVAAETAKTLAEAQAASQNVPGPVTS